jgi:copper transport protein
MAVWLGGLAVLAVCLLRPAGDGNAGGGTDDGPGGGPPAVVPGGYVAELGRVLPRWSRTAMVAVTLLVVSGLFQSWREVATLPAVIHTDYGLFLLYKVLTFVVILGAAELARRWVAQHFHPRIVVHALASIDAPAPPANPEPRQPQVGPNEVTTLRRGVIFEVVLGAAVLAVTAVLVNTVPAKAAYSPPFSDTVIAGPLTVDVRVEPTKSGPQAIHVYAYDPLGRPQPLEEAKAQLSLPDAGVGPFDVPLVLPGPGHATAEGVQVPLPGTWQLRLTLRVSDFDQYVTTVFYEVR